MSIVSVESPAGLGAETLESDRGNDQAAPAAWVEPTLTALFTIAAVLVVSLIAVALGMS